MQSIDARLKSFNHRLRTWPHLNSSYKATPRTLSDAGFYWKPSSPSPDNVICFLCSKSLDGWEETDDPIDEHLSHSRDCGWAIIKSIPTMEDEDQLPFRWDDEGELPKGKRMSKARLDTFGDWWPYENVRGWFGTTKRMANAGFYYTPSDTSEDNVQCPYCGLGLDGWEAEDDPIHEHQRRKPTCAFFATRAAAPTKASAAKAAKNKKQNSGSTEIQHSGDQKPNALISDKQDLRKISRINGRAGKSLSQQSDSTEELRTENSQQSNTSTNSISKISDGSALPSTSVGLDIPKSATRGTSKKTNPKVVSEVDTANLESSTPKSNSLEPIPDSQELSDNSSYSSSAGQKRQKHRQESEDESAAVSAPRQLTKSVISVVITKKRKLTKAEKIHNSQIQELEDGDVDKENTFRDTVNTPLSPNDHSSQYRDDEKPSDENKKVTRSRKGKKTLEQKPKSTVIPKRAPSRTAKRNLRTVELLKSPAKKKASKTLIEIFELPDEGGNEQIEPASIQPVQDTSNLSHSDDKSTSDAGLIGNEKSDDDDDYNDYDGDDIASTMPMTPPRNSPSLPVTPQQTSRITLEYPITPVHQQAVSMQDIETANVVVVDALTPNRRVASSIDIEGWEDEDRRESSPFVSPSKWDVSALSTSTPKIKKLLYKSTPPMAAKHKVKDMIGNMKSPLKKHSRIDFLSPEKKQELLINHLGNLMQEDDNAEVLAVAENALKKEVKQLKQSQHKARNHSTTVTAEDSYENEDVEMQELDSNDPYSNRPFVVTPVKKTTTFDVAPVTPPNRTPLPISNVISALGAASRKNHQVAASPFVKTPVKKSVNLLRLGDTEIMDNVDVKKPARVEPSTRKIPKDFNPFLETNDESDDNFEDSDVSKDFYGEQTIENSAKGTGSQTREQLRLHEDDNENEKRLKLLKESGLSERELKMTVEDFHRVILEEQVRQLELLGEAWVQRFQEESDRVRTALLDEGDR